MQKLSSINEYVLIASFKHLSLIYLLHLFTCLILPISLLHFSHSFVFLRSIIKVDKLENYSSVINERDPIDLHVSLLYFFLIDLPLHLPMSSYNISSLIYLVNYCVLLLSYLSKSSTSSIDLPLLLINRCRWSISSIHLSYADLPLLLIFVYHDVVCILLLLTQLADWSTPLIELHLFVIYLFYSFFSVYIRLSWSPSLLFLSRYYSASLTDLPILLIYLIQGRPSTVETKKGWNISNMLLFC